MLQSSNNVTNRNFSQLTKLHMIYRCNGTLRLTSQFLHPHQTAPASMKALHQQRPQFSNHLFEARCPKLFALECLQTFQLTSCLISKQMWDGYCLSYKSDNFSDYNYRLMINFVKWAYQKTAETISKRFNADLNKGTTIVLTAGSCYISVTVIDISYKLKF